MEFLRAAKRKSLLSETVYILLNIGLAVAVLLLVWAINSPLPAFALVLLSKWRILAVRPRYWFAHILTNLVDIIVSLSLVVFLYAAGTLGGDTGFIAQIILTILYILWLLLLKPRSKRTFVVAQAGVAIFVGVSATYMGAYDLPSSLIVACMWLIGFAAARHVLSGYSEDNLTLMSFIFGLVFAEIGWIAYHWTIAYSLPIIGEIPQIAIISVLIGFLAERVYASYHSHGTVRQVDIVLPLIFTLSIIAILLFTPLNSVNSGSI